MQIIPQLVFYVFAAIALGSAFMVIVSRQPVKGVLFLVLTFFASAVLWMLLEAEFLALVLIFVYVGAVMTLFLFVVMMLNLDVAPRMKGWVRYLPLGMIVIAVLTFIMLYTLTPHDFSAIHYQPVVHPANYSNTQQLGLLLYTKYFYPFEIAAVLLLVAIIAAISLTFRGRRSNSKAQRVAKQVSVRPQDRLTLIK